MSAQDNLNPEQFYHGSTHHFRRGQVIDPAAPHPRNFASSADDKFYFDTRPSKAVEYAGLLDAESHDLYHEPGGYRSLYTVEPLEGYEPDSRRGDDVRYNPDDHQTAYQTSGKVRITGKHILTDEEMYPSPLG